jgi:alpha-1,2-mannosyltransferase
LAQTRRAAEPAKRPGPYPILNGSRLVCAVAGLSAAPKSSIEDSYRNLTAAALAFMVCMEVMYFVLSPAPSFRIPSMDGIGQTAIGRDFLNIWIGGRAALTDGPAAFFDYWHYNVYLQAFFGSEELHHYFWSYPPHILLFIWPFGLMPYLAAFALWSVFGIAVFLLAASVGGVERKHLVFVAVAPAIAVNLFFGQNGSLMAALLIGGLISLDRRPVLAGILFGILTIKPQLGLLLPVMLVLTGRWRVIVATVATALALFVLTAWLYGMEIWWEYLAKVVPQQRYLQENGAGLLFLQIPSAFYAGRLVGLPLPVDWAIQMVVSVAALAAVVWTYWRPRDPVLSTALLVTATFLFSPYTLNYDMVTLAWVAALLRQRAELAPRDHALILAVWTLPVTMMVVGLARIPFGFLVLAAFAGWLLWRLSRAGAAVSITPAEPVPAPA